MTKPNEDQLTGRARTHLTRCWSGAFVHRDALSSLEALRDLASQAGFELSIASSFRDFERQQLIWQEKINGIRPVYSSAGERLDVSQLTDEELLSAILRWSALPGVSRHHWGTDFDIYDAAAVAADYPLQLVPEEYELGGPFYEFSHWLKELVESGQANGFFYPYLKDEGGVSPEPWHISYQPVAQEYQGLWSYERFQQMLDDECWLLNDSIKQRSEEIFVRYVAPMIRLPSECGY